MFRKYIIGRKNGSNRTKGNKKEIAECIFGIPIFIFEVPKTIFGTSISIFAIPILYFGTAKIVFGSAEMIFAIAILVFGTPKMKIGFAKTNFAGGESKAAVAEMPSALWFFIVRYGETGVFT